MLMTDRALGAQSENRLVSLTNAGLLRDGRWLVRGIDFSIRRGEVVTLIGPNGAGKSTTAKLAIGVLRPNEGAVDRRQGLRIGYVPQKLAIDWTMPLSVRPAFRIWSMPRSVISREANSSGLCLPVRSPGSRISWYWTSLCRASISRVRAPFTN
jgi:ABC-type Mn2+/Zn2+ transport system ATPase subunit